jgi:hypothetical protein
LRRLNVTWTRGTVFLRGMNKCWGQEGREGGPDRKVQKVTADEGVGGETLE